MKPAVPSLLAALAAVAACHGSTSNPDPGEPDSGVAHPDAAIDATPAEPKPAFTVSNSISGQLAIDDAGIRPTFIVNGQTYVSVVIVSLTETATNRNCGVTLAPTFVQFGSASTSTRHFKTVVLDFATATVLDDKCGWDDAYILAQLAAQYGHYFVGFAQARFAEDQPYVDVFLDAEQPFSGSTANIVYAGGGSAYQMMADGTVVDVMVQPTPGTLVPALYEF
jgi:hypothetical protein